jgi:hypothetical protein
VENGGTRASFQDFREFLQSCGNVLIINVLSLLRVSPESRPVYRRGFSALPNGLFRMAAEAFRRRDTVFPGTRKRLSCVAEPLSASRENNGTDLLSALFRILLSVSPYL